MTIRTKVCVLGAGGGGTGCVYRLIKHGIDTAVIDKNPDFGGTAVFSGVDGFEPGVSLDGIHQELSRILTEKGQGFVVNRVPNGRLLPEEDRDPDGKDQFPEYPWALADKTDLPYSETLSRKWGKRFQFDPAAMTAAIRELLDPYSGHLTEFFGWAYESCTAKQGKITSLTIRRGEERVTIEAEYFVDASGDIVLARDAGCDHTSGTEARDTYGEPGAPEEASDRVNAATYCFRITRAEDPEHIDPEPEERDLAWEPQIPGIVACFSEYPDGDINVNMLPTMQGREYMALGDDADRVGHIRVRGYWHYLQTVKKLRGWTIKHIYSAGVRETYRLRGKHILTETEVRAGGSALSSVAAIADHALDIHGASGMLRELEKPYAIPLECTMPKEYENLFVACRGASFSHIAGASARLIRTMLSLGESVGEHIAKLLAE